MDYIILGALAATSAFFLFLYFFGTGGGFPRAQFDVMKRNEDALRAFFDVNVFRPDVVKCAWPAEIGSVPRFALAVDRNRNLLAVCETAGTRWQCSLYAPARILRVDLLEDSHTVAHVGRGAQLGGTLVGAAVAGPVGAVIGGLSSGQSARAKLSRLGLQVLLDGANGLYTIDFCFWDAGSAKDGWLRLNPDEQRRVRAEAREWMYLIERVMRSSEAGHHLA